jgi:hypothetical protein
MGRNHAGLSKGIKLITHLEEEFEKDLFVPGKNNEFNQSLEKAMRVKDFIQFANKHKFDEEGNYNQLAGARQTLGQDYLVEDENGNEVELPVTKGMTDKAIAMMQKDPSILNMDQAIKATSISPNSELITAFIA